MLPDNISETAHQAAIVRLVYELTDSVAEGEVSMEQYACTVVSLATHIVMTGALTPDNISDDEMRAACAWLQASVIRISEGVGNE
jgi:hypothetical protein